MANTLTIRYTIPTGSIRFHHWLPTKDKYLLTKNCNGVIISFWFDNSCLQDPQDAINFAKQTNVIVKQVYVDLELNDIPEKFAEFVYNERDCCRQIHYGIKPGDPCYEEYKKTYLELDALNLKTALDHYNRFISYSRNHKSQYWLEEQKFDPENIYPKNCEFNANVKSDTFDWVRWGVHQQVHFTIYAPTENNLIREDEWGNIEIFFKGNERPNIVFELLSNSWILIDKGYRRSALIEAVSALEIAVYSFCQNPNLNELMKPPEITNRIDYENLKSQSEHLGFSGSIRYLIPLLFPPEILPNKFLYKCYEAIQIRNNVIHNRQRDVKEELIRPLVGVLDKVSRVLLKYTL